MYRYTDAGELFVLAQKLDEYAKFQSEYGNTDLAQGEIQETVEAMRKALENLKGFAPDPVLKAKEPDDLDTIRSFRADGPRRLMTDWHDEEMQKRMHGAFLGRLIGCTLGVPVEGWQVDEMKQQAAYSNMAFPPVDYWKDVSFPYHIQYGKSPRSGYARESIDGVAVDDDINYTLTALLILEKYGINFTTQDVGEFWAKYLPIACTAEGNALNNLKAGIKAEQCAEEGDFCYRHNIGAAIRADGWAYVCAGWPEKAAEMAYRDAYLSHRRGGIYGEMFMAAAVAAAFSVKDPLEAIRIGMTEIPKESVLYEDLAWALEKAPEIENYEQARAAVDERFKGMVWFHANNNACLMVFALKLGEGDFTRSISNMVAMGMDNDCTGATVGSIMGAICGVDNIPAYWSRNFHDTVFTFVNDCPEMKISDVVSRFLKIARQVNEG